MEATPQQFYEIQPKKMFVRPDTATRRRMGMNQYQFEEQFLVSQMADMDLDTFSPSKAAKSNQFLAVPFSTNQFPEESSDCGSDISFTKD